MKPWNNTRRVEVEIDFGAGSMAFGSAVGIGRQIQFAYADPFIAERLDPSPIKFAKRAGPRAGAPVFDGLPGVLFDSLPDGWSRLVLDRYLRSAGFDPGTLAPLDRLELVGQDGPGALTYSGSRLLPVQAPAVDFDTAAALISGAPHDEDADRILAAATMARSLGGARPKAYVYMHAGDFTTRNTPGAEPWIIKFPAKNDGPEAGAIEYAYSIMARAAGINMPPTTLLNSGRTAGYFAIRRFDREPGGGRLHMHSLAGILNATADSGISYHDLLMVTGALMQPRGAHLAGFDEQIRRMAFNVLARNRDDHVKNHAFLMDRHGHWRCAPAYDLTFADGERHALMIADDRRNVEREDMLVVTRQLTLEDSHVLGLIDEVADAVKRWPEHAREAGVSRQMTKDIASAVGVPISSGPKGRDKAKAAWLYREDGRDDRG